MYLKSIDLKGFKSFPERTKLEFSPGVSVVVGPNGSGKSNITDAVLWALGEQSPGAIRGSSMQDVISAGGAGVGRRAEAEVEVVIDNSDGRAATEFSEVAIRRRLSRDGDGEYRMNGARCRLADVIEVLSDANLGRRMHSVISQGRVEAIVNSKPRDRRALVEEAAGLGKHRRRRRRAELKLRATADNLARAQDLEREARGRLRPLKRQAEAAELGARLLRQEQELRARIVAEELRFGEDRLKTAQEAAAAARAARDRVADSLGEVSRRRQAAEERFAARDRERTEAWGLVNRLHGRREQLSVAGATLGSKVEEFARRLESDRAELGPLTLEPAESGELESARARQLVAELDEVEAGLSAAGDGLGQARLAESPEDARLAALAAVRGGAERASRHARRAEGLMGERRRAQVQRRLSAAEGALAAARSAQQAVEGLVVALRGRIDAAEARVTGSGSGGDEIAEELRSCSAREAELQAEINAASDRLTEAEVEAAHLGDRRAEAAKELATLSEALGEQIPAAEEPLAEEERAELDRKLARLARRREQIGPINPLAEREYEEAKEQVDELRAQREDVEQAIAELETLINDIDGEIEQAFEETFAATAANFGEMIEHLFPGGRGRLSRVALQPAAGRSTEDDAPAAGSGGSDGADGAAVDGAGDDAFEDEEKAEPELGVEIEVTPAGKSMRRLSLLSGGEKSLVALAFVFAVFLARPSPFYILDEVEAALDDANIDRFLQLIRRFSDRAQFVIVTHQKRTMDAADVLYGVTMGNDGVTRVVSRRLPRDLEAATAGNASGGSPALSEVPAPSQVAA
ncbi:MAG TPA: chromosome segregation SMC family protein [Solirubrobacterales bacterium]|nr:chromosome segregation SMC family protein [Solirubrobacterales bacterium]